MRTCLENHKYCNANCCREFRVLVNPKQRFRKGDVLIIPIKDKDLQYYFSLKGLIIINEELRLELDDFVKRNRYLYIYKTCIYLKKDNKCLVHNTDKKPLHCLYPNDDGEFKNDVYIVKNCRFKNVSPKSQE
jgi:hypothetical protein